MQGTSKSTISITVFLGRLFEFSTDGIPNLNTISKYGVIQ